MERRVTRAGVWLALVLLGALTIGYCVALSTTREY